MSKVNFFLENKREWEVGRRAEYVGRLTRMEASTIFKARSRMLEVKNKTIRINTETEYADCNNQENDQLHVLQECSALGQMNLQKATMENIINEDVKTLTETVVFINNIMEKVQNR